MLQFGAGRRHVSTHKSKDTREMISGDKYRVSIVQPISAFVRNQNLVVNEIYEILTVV